MIQNVNTATWSTKLITVVVGTCRGLGTNYHDIDGLSNLVNSNKTQSKQPTFLGKHIWTIITIVMVYSLSRSTLEQAQKKSILLH